MARQIINVGTTANDGTGDGLRTAYIKCNDNFQELYNTTLTPTEIPNGTSNVKVFEDGNVTIGINGTGNVVEFSQFITDIDANLTVSGDITGAGNVTGNDFYVGDILTVTGTIGSNLVPDGNGTRSLGSNTSRWSDLFLTGSTLTLGGIVFKDNGSNVLGIFGPDGTTPATISSDTIDTSIISNGTSNIQLVGTDGNATVSVNGTGNVVVITDDTVEVTGNVDSGNLNVTSMITGASANITGNIDAGNVNVQDIVAAGYLMGDGGLISNVTAVSNVAVSQIANGSSVIGIAGSGGNIELTVGGTQTGTLTSSGANITGYLNATGNANVGNLGTAGSISATGNVSGGNLSLSGALSMSGVLSGVTSTTISGNITGGNLNTGGVVVATGNIDGGNLNSSGVVVASGNITGGNIQSNSVFTAVGNITGGNISSLGIISAIGNISGNYFIGNGSQLTGLETDNISNGTSSFEIVASNGNIQGNIAGTTKILITSGGANITGNANISSAVIATGNVTGGNLITAGRVVANGNISGGNVSTAGVITATGNITAGNVSTAGVITATGNITGGNLTASSGTANVAILRTQTATFTTLANVTANTAATSTTSGSLRTAGGAGVVGNLYVGGLASITGNISGGNISSSGVITATGNITGGNIITAGLASVSSIVKTGSNAVGNIGQTDNRFNTVFAQATSALYADLAERYASDQEYEPGTVLVFGGSAEVTASQTDADPYVAGVVSTAPAYLMNDGLDSEFSVAVALVGRVPTKVRGPIRRGQMLVSADNGYAKAETNPAIGTVIGKALEDFDGAEGVIEVVIGRL